MRLGPFFIGLLLCAANVQAVDSPNVVFMLADDVHEPPLLDMKGPTLLVGDALTIEPGLYRRDMGGVRVEDRVVVTQDGCVNLNTLSEELTWS